ncbi:MAG: gliding motility-associated C-terminal domain-containing protein [Dinghuibacter sp.]|nr:gliding motility-associated C-terminal domain-containing protein [Dinghuibacter sp.]
MPTAFSPNADGVNDVFRAVAYGIIRFDYLAVYNRYGNEVFRTTDIRRGWDGTINGVAAPPETYVFQVKGFDFKNREVFKKGTVVLIR